MTKKVFIMGGAISSNKNMVLENDTEIKNELNKF